MAQLLHFSLHRPVNKLSRLVSLLLAFGGFFPMEHNVCKFVSSRHSVHLVLGLLFGHKLTTIETLILTADLTCLDWWDRFPFFAKYFARAQIVVYKQCLMDVKQHMWFPIPETFLLNICSIE